MSRRAPNRWLVLAIGLAAQTSTCVFLYGVPMLVPELRRSEHLSLTAAGWFVAAPTIGLLFTLVAWGVVADRRGERDVMAVGLAMAGVLLLLAAVVHPIVLRAVLLGLAGASGASVNAASGRVVLGWFAAHERGTAMGVRQTAQPLGVGIAALVLPPVADHYGLGWALVVPAGLSLVTAALVALLVVDPVRSVSTPGHVSGSPYRTPTLWRLHGASTLLVVPQFAVSVFALEYLVSRRGWSPTSAGQLIFGFQLAGAAGRLAVGRWSDRVGSRLGPMRVVAFAAAASMLALGLGAAAGSVLAVAAIGVGAVVTVADNGLGFTAVAELAGSDWAGRALGTQNTAQNIAASLTPPVLGALITVAGYGTGFAVTAVFPLLAMLATPVAAETARRRRLESASLPV
ncbi:MAG TPA: MFS transporter [Mycobacteriales bacterium]|nr:MFS transporter [Mycobacteriales bacterium]